ncbi:hypothetical protein LWI28_006609 [Acer negundo]|uniref:Uncharacterized protein n=1 Tax=Acer negundo TaxID=4023 RepID=A0AAD5JRX9_ACENE|nr:hypothetical protein LWI28_006609 [Acer negundo]
MLKDEEEGVEEEVETTEIVFDSGGGLIEVLNPEPTPIKANIGSDLVSPIKLNIPELEGDEPETRSLVTEIKPPDSEIITYLVKTQEATIEATSEDKNTKPRPKPDNNRNPEPTLSYPNPMFPSIQTQSFHAVNQNIAAFLDVNRHEPWPNKPFINTNLNRLNPWPNKLPTLTYFTRPKPWPRNHPICTVPKPRTGSNETKKFGKQNRRRSYQFQPQVKMKSGGQLSVANHVLNWFKIRVLTVDQLRNLVIAILPPLPEFDPDQQLPEEEESVRWSGDRFWEHECKEEGLWRLGFMDFRKGSKLEGLWKKRLGISKKIWEFFLIHGCHLVKEEVLGVVLLEKVKDLGVSEVHNKEHERLLVDTRLKNEKGPT